MQLNEIDAVRLQTAQTAFDAFQNCVGRPVFAPNPARMPAFGEKEKLIAPFSANCLADRILAALITFRRVDYVNAGIECAVQHPPYILDALARSARAAKAQHGHIHVRPSEAAFFHRCHPRHDLARCHPKLQFGSSRAQSRDPGA